jgi:hypothetical protein
MERRDFRRTIVVLALLSLACRQETTTPTVSDTGTTATSTTTTPKRTEDMATRHIQRWRQDRL